MAFELLLSPGQVTFFLCYGWTLCLWLISEYLNRVRKGHGYDQILDAEDVEMREQKRKEPGPAHGEAGHGHGVANSRPETPGTAPRSPSFTRPQAPQTIMQDVLNSGLVRIMLFDLERIKQERSTLKAMSEFGTLMVWYFVCDRTPAFPEGHKSYNRDTFAFVFLALTAAAFGSSLQTVKAPQLLNRPQTEEWKGWMQVLFLLYHYFEAAEIYNAIRIFIAAYVWMTGFGNFSYYYKTSDFSIGRFAQMMWRLNFLVFFACLVLRNSYMLYYICPMHTIYTVMVYGSLAIMPHLNQNNAAVLTKMALCVVAVLIFWDCKPVFYLLWRPFTFLMGYVDPRKPSDDQLYEWYFRSSLDRFVWIYGMLCAFLHPWAASMLNLIDSMQPVKRFTVRSAVTAVCGVIGYFWYVHVYSLPKIEYNKIHPYTSWIPITLFFTLRNMTPTLRLHHMRLYGWLGCITLETYISQFHIWLRSSIPDGQPKMLLTLVPGPYPLINFAVCSGAYVFVSHRLFELTNSLKNAAVPHDNNALLMRNTLLLGAVGALLYFTCYGFLAIFVYTRGAPI